MTNDAPVFAQVRKSLSRRALLLGVGLLLEGQPAVVRADAMMTGSGGAGSGVAAPGRAGPTTGRADVGNAGMSVRFEIPAQPIDSALDAYSTVSGLEVFYDGALASGRRSSAVKGTVTRDVALRELLVGTGLVARPSTKGSFTLVPATPPRTSVVVYQDYFAEIQARVARTLCARTETGSGDTDVIVRLWIAPSGTVLQAQTVAVSDAPADAQTAQEHMEATLAATLHGLVVGEPPAGMPQPVMLAILARPAGAPSGCAETVTGSR